MKIRFTRHALDKFYILRSHGVRVLRSHVVRTVCEPERVDYSQLPFKIAQRAFDKNYVLRVVYKEQNGVKTIITFYPGRKSQYEKK